LDALKKALDMSLDCELTDEGDIKVSGKPKKPEPPPFLQQQNPQQADAQGGDGFPHEKPFTVEKAKGESWLVTKIPKEVKKKDES